MTLRKFLFWVHLGAGSVAGVVILLMSVTGVLLTYEGQITRWADRRSYSPPEAESGARMPVEALLAKVRESGRPLPTSVTIRQDSEEPVELVHGRGRTVYVNQYTGEVLGEGSEEIRAFFHAVTNWHRWLGVEGPGRASARALTGACNLAFLFLVISGIYLWWPRSWRQLRSVIWFRGGLSGRARDFNWHNVLGSWCAAPLFFVVATAVLMSYPWANNLLYRLSAGDPPARPASGRRGPAGDRGLHSKPRIEGLNQLVMLVQNAEPGWRSISIALSGGSSARVTFSVDKGGQGAPRPARATHAGQENRKSRAAGGILGLQHGAATPKLGSLGAHR